MESISKLELSLAEIEGKVNQVGDLLEEVLNQLADSEWDDNFITDESIRTLKAAAKLIR